MNRLAGIHVIKVVVPPCPKRSPGGWHHDTIGDEGEIEPNTRLERFVFITQVSPLRRGVEGKSYASKQTRLCRAVRFCRTRSKILAGRSLRKQPAM